MHISPALLKILLPFYFAAILLFSINATGQNTDSAQHQITVSGQLRPRIEIRDGAFRPLSTGEKPAALVSERIRLSIDYTFQNKFSVRISPQSVGIWGQANMLQGSGTGNNQLVLFEAWTKWNISPSWYLKFGRQVISLDDERFFGALDWAQGGRAHDALSVQFDRKKIGVKGFFAYNQNYKTLYANNLSNPAGNLYSTQDASPYKWMQAVWASVPLSEQTRATVLATNLGLQQARSASIDTSVFYIQTFGGNVFHTGRSLTMNASAFYQFGRNTGGMPVDAWLLAVYAGYNIDHKWHLGLGSDWLSGDDPGKTISKNSAFNPFFHTGHKYYGAMDYYYAGNPNRNAGLADQYLRLNYKRSKALSIHMDFHQFFAPHPVSNAAEQYSSNLGQEADLFLSCKINQYAQLTGGYSFYLTTPALQFLKTVVDGRQYQQWLWMSLNVTPVFIKSKY